MQRIYRNPKPRKSEVVVDLRPHTDNVDGYGFGFWSRHGEYYIGLRSRGNEKTLCCFIWLGTPSFGATKRLDPERFHSFEVEGTDWLIVIADPSEDLFVIESRLSSVLYVLSLRTGHPHNRLSSSVGGRLNCTGGNTDGDGVWILSHGQQGPYECTHQLLHWPTDTKKVSGFIVLERALC